jgi:DNA-binding NtrC family response regulator
VAAWPTDRGIEVTEAHSRAEASSRLLTGVFDVMIADLGLPDGHGLDVAQMSAYRQPDCPVVIVTGGAQCACGQIFAMCGKVVAIFRKAPETEALYAFIQHLERKMGARRAPGAALHSNSI